MNKTITKNNLSSSSAAIKEGYRSTSFGIMPEGWEIKKLENIFEFKNGLNGDKSRYGKGVKFINVMEVLYNTRITSDMISGSLTISEKQQKLFVVKKGDVLFNRTSETQNEIALAAVYDDDIEVVFGGFVIRGRPNENLLSDNFKRYCFDSPLIRKQIISKGQGAVRVNIGQADLGKVKLPIPPLPEQKAIADCLSTWDRGIEKLAALIQSKKEQKKGLMQQLLTGEKRLEGFCEEWKEVRLKEVIKLQGGYAFKSDRFKKEGIPVIRISNLSAKNSEVDLSDVVYYSKISQTNFHVSNGDLLIAMSGATTGKTAIYTNSDHAYLNQRVGLFKSKSNKELDYRILYYIVQTNYFNNEINKMLSTGAQPNISSSDIENINIYLPRINEQMAISNVLDASDKEIKLLQSKLEVFKTQKKGLMQVLLTGERRLVEN